MTVNPFIDYFRCPDQVAVIGPSGGPSLDAGYFRFGGTVCYGRPVGVVPAVRPDARVEDVAAPSAEDGSVLLPFDLAEVVDNLRLERYTRVRPALEKVSTLGAVRALYYRIRPVLPVPVRKHVQRLSLAGWRHVPFPHWPVDVTVETVMRSVAALAVRANGGESLPFIWFWPEGASAAVMLTHDVESPAGVRFCGELANMDHAFQLKSAFQVVPDPPWDPARVATRRLVDELHARGFEVNVHDLTHDGRLFRDREHFLKRAGTINARAREFGSRGFRSGAMYRRQDWLPALECAFDMSVPNVAHLEPQRGGCCTVLPYFVRDVLELPLTTIQDYSLFHVLRDYSTALWRRQIEIILANHGLISFIVHPDYLREVRARRVYIRLLEHLGQLRDHRRAWVAWPSEIDRWWRDRRQMRLVRDGDSWRIEGPRSERARVAVARLEGEQVVYDVERYRRAA